MIEWTVWDVSSVNLLDLPTYLSDKLGLGSTFTGGILASFLFLILTMIPFVFATRKTQNVMPVLIIVSCVVLGFCTAIAWFPAWFFTVIVLLIAGLYAAKFKDMI